LIFTQDDFDRYLRERKQRDQEGFREDFLDDFDRWKKHQKDRTVPVAEGGRIGYNNGGGLKIWGKSVDEQWSNLNEDQKKYIRENFPDQVPEGQAAGGRIGLKKGSTRDRLQKDWKSYSKLMDLLYAAPPILQDKPGSYTGSGRVRDEEETRLKERFMYGDLDKAEGGRASFGLGSLSRRTFLKMMAAIAALPIVGKGITKVAPKAIPKVTETIVRGADGMPTYITDLITVVKAKGARDIIEGVKRSDYSNVHRYKGVEVIEDGDGNIKIKSDKSGVSTDPYTGKTHEGIAQENHIQINKGEYVKASDEGAEGSIKTVDEYTEGTVYPDMDGKMKDWEDGLDEAIHLDFKKIADEVDTLIIKKSKKASGGLAHMLGE